MDTMTEVKPGNRLRDRAARPGHARERHGSARLGAQPGGRSLDSNKIEAAYVGYHKTLNDRFEAAPSIYQTIATVVETDQLVDRQIWVTGMPRMREWVGDKVLHKLRAESHPIVTTPKEASIEIPKKDIQNDQFGMWKPKIERLGDTYVNALNELAITMLAAGVQGVALGATYDGQNLIDTDHTTLSVGGTSQSNKVTGALSTTTYNQAWAAYLGLKDHNGQPINGIGRRMKLVVGPANRAAARTILESEPLANGADNLDEGTADLVVTQWLTARTVEVQGVSVTLTGLEWFLIPEGSSAILIHVKQKPVFLSVEGPDEFTFRTGIYLYGIEAEFGAAYGLWQEVVGGPGS